MEFPISLWCDVTSLATEVFAPESNVVDPEEYCNEKLWMHLFAEQLGCNLCVFDFTVSRAIRTGINSAVNEEVQQ